MLDRVTRLSGSPCLLARVTRLVGLPFFHVNGYARVTRLTGLKSLRLFLDKYELNADKMYKFRTQMVPFIRN